MGDGDIEAPESEAAKLLHNARYIARFDIDEGVVRGETQRLEGGIVHRGRQGVPDGMAQQGKWGDW